MTHDEQEEIRDLVGQLVREAIERIRNEESVRIDQLERKMIDLVTMLKGDEDGVSAGLFGRVRRHQDVLYGKDDERFGLIQKVNMMWRGHVWLACTASAGVGGLAVWLFERFR